MFLFNKLLDVHFACEARTSQWWVCPKSWRVRSTRTERSGGCADVHQNGCARAWGLCSVKAVLCPCLKRFVARSNLSALLGDRVIALPASTSELLWRFFHAQIVAVTTVVEMQSWVFPIDNTNLGCKQSSYKTEGNARAAVHQISL